MTAAEQLAAHYQQLHDGKAEERRLHLELAASWAKLAAVYAKSGRTAQAEMCLGAASSLRDALAQLEDA